MLWILTVYILLLVAFFIFAKKAFQFKSLKLISTENEARLLYDRLSREHAGIKDEVDNFTQSVESITEIYDISKDVCKSLDENKIFSVFKEQAAKFINTEDIRIVKEESELDSTTDYSRFPLYIEKEFIGFLVAGGVAEGFRQKFYILANQFLLGVKSAILFKRVADIAITDSLTLALSRRHCLERLNEEMLRSNKFKLKFSLLMADVDYFKSYNDKFGHLVGDVVLKDIVAVMKDSLRQIDLVGRYGGEEFIIVLPETDKKGAGLAAQRLRKAIEDKEIKAYDESLKVTISIGIATFPEDASSSQELIDKTDWSLYKAKQSGRNKVCAYGVFDEGGAI